MGKLMESSPVCTELIRLLRVQRHDFINHIQVVHAMLELKKFDQAMRYIEDLAKDDCLIADTLAMHTAKKDCQYKASAE